MICQKMIRPNRLIDTTPGKFWIEINYEETATDINHPKENFVRNEGNTLGTARVWR